MIRPYLWSPTSCKIFCLMGAIFTAEKPLIITNNERPLRSLQFWEFSNKQMKMDASEFYFAVQNKALYL